MTNIEALIQRGLGDARTVDCALAFTAAAALAFRAAGRPGQGIEYLRDALAQTPASEDTTGTLHEELGHTLRAAARPREAAAAYETAIQIWIALARHNREAVCRLRHGDALRLLGRYRAARENYMTALRLFQALGNQLGLADAYECLGDVECVTADFSTAVQHYERAREVFRVLREGAVGMVNTCHSLGETRLAQNDVAGARLDYDQALSSAVGIGDLQGQANAILGVAKTHLHNGDSRDAHLLLGHAEKLYRRIDDRLGLANTHIALGDLYTATHDPALADRAYEYAERVLTEIGIPANRILTSLRRMLGRQLAWDDPRIIALRDEFAQLTGRGVDDAEQCRRWPLERKGSVFHGELESSN
jgi:hypothetical protein